MGFRFPLARSVTVRSEEIVTESLRNLVQPGILAPPPRLARYLEFSLAPDVDPRPAVERLLELAGGDQLVVGLGRSLVTALGNIVEGLEVFPVHVGEGFEVPSTPSAHVKRAEQESFEPEAFLLRRSMPWASADGEGLVFVAFGRNFDAYGTILNRMVGGEDGVPDALFRFTRPVTGSYFWCPPVAGGRLDLSVLGF